MQPNNPYNNQPQYQAPYPPQGAVYTVPAQGSNMQHAITNTNGVDIEETAHKWWILAVGGALALVLCVAGIAIQVSFHATDASGRSIDELDAEIKSLDTQTATMSEDEGAVFEKEGFSSNYYASTDERSEIELEKAELIKLRDDAVERERAGNPFRTGTAWFFIGAIIVLIIAITAFIRL